VHHYERGARGNEPENKARYRWVDTSTSIDSPRSPLIITSPEAAALLPPRLTGDGIDCDHGQGDDHVHYPLAFSVTRPQAMPSSGGVMSDLAPHPRHGSLLRLMKLASWTLWGLAGKTGPRTALFCQQHMQEEWNKDGDRTPRGSRSVR
jgi:hypothetical protein